MTCHAYPERPSDSALPVVDPEAAETPPDPVADLRVAAATARQRAQTMRDLAAVSEREGRDREAASLRAAAVLFDRLGFAYDDGAEARLELADQAARRPQEPHGPRAEAYLVGGVATLLVAVGARLLAESPVAGCLALGGAIACIIAAIALAVNRGE